jgi:transcriptional regulator with XRE-family HTH domain
MTKGRKEYGKKVAVEKTHTITNGLVLPDNVQLILKSLDGKTDALVRNSYIAALRYAGWTLQSIGDATGVSRERIRQIESTIDLELVRQIKMFPNEFPIPALPTETVIEYKYEAYEPSPETLARLLELQPLAQQVRSHSPRYRAEAEEYVALLWKAHNEEKVTLYRLAKCLGVTHGALRFRLVRYGYMTPSQGGSSRSYRPVMQKNRATA